MAECVIANPLPTVQLVPVARFEPLKSQQIHE